MNRNNFQHFFERFVTDFGGEALPETHLESLRIFFSVLIESSLN